MATSPYYQKTHDKWEDRPSTKTPILGKDLDQIEEGIYQNSKKLFDNGVGGAYTASKIDVNGSPQPDSGNGHLTVSVGLNNKVSGQSSQAFGTNHTVEGGYSAAFGYGNKVENTQSNECFVEGACISM